MVEDLLLLALLSGQGKCHVDFCLYIDRLAINRRGLVAPLLHCLDLPLVRAAGGPLPHSAPSRFRPFALGRKTLGRKSSCAEIKGLTAMSSLV